MVTSDVNYIPVLWRETHFDSIFLKTLNNLTNVIFPDALTYHFYPLISNKSTMINPRLDPYFATLSREINP